MNGMVINPISIIKNWEHDPVEHNVLFENIEGAICSKYWNIAIVPPIIVKGIVYLNIFEYLFLYAIKNIITKGYMNIL